LGGRVFGDQLLRDEGRHGDVQSGEEDRRRGERRLQGDNLLEHGPAPFRLEGQLDETNAAWAATARWTDNVDWNSWRLVVQAICAYVTP
jgi:hypothetical protein